MTAVSRRSRRSSPGESKPPKIDIQAIVKSFAEFRAAKRAETAAKTKYESLRDNELMPALVAYGEAHGDKGQHLAIDLPEEVDGFVRIVRRANTSRLLDLDKAEELMTEKGILAECQTVSVVIPDIPGTMLAELDAALKKAKLERFGVVQVAQRFSQDAMMAYHQKNRDELTEEEIDSLIVEETTYSFFPEKR